jgi:hypothetical protein
MRGLAVLAEATGGELPWAVQALEVRLGLVAVEGLLVGEGSPAATDGADESAGSLEGEGLAESCSAPATAIIGRSRAGSQVLLIDRDQTMPLRAFANQPELVVHGRSNRARWVV